MTIPRIGLVGPYTSKHKRILSALLFVPGEHIGIKAYQSVRTLLNDWRRPDLALVVLIEHTPCDNLPALRETLRTPIMCLVTILMKNQPDFVDIKNEIARAHIRDVETAAHHRLSFALAARRHTIGRQHWPTKLVPVEHQRQQ